MAQREAGDRLSALLPLAARTGHRHARRVRHATEEDLDHVEPLLVELRKFGQLRERKRGYFSWRSRAFLHFHEDAGDIYVDVKLDREFERMKVSGPGDRAAFLARVRGTLEQSS
jgi:hypothetical protein